MRNHEFLLVILPIECGLELPNTVLGLRGQRSRPPPVRSRVTVGTVMRPVDERGSVRAGYRILRLLPDHLIAKITGRDQRIATAKYVLFVRHFLLRTRHESGSSRLRHQLVDARHSIIRLLGPPREIIQRIARSLIW